MKKCIDCEERPTRYKNRCARCYVYLRTNKIIRPKTIEIKIGCVRKDGYVSIQKKELIGHENACKKGRMLEHTYIMSNHLKRPLFKGESVHHKNGIRNDNRIENLELWTVNQPSGQIVEDKINWAKNFLKLYGYQVS